jgi:hypothetical protein
VRRISRLKTDNASTDETCQFELSKVGNRQQRRHTLLNGRAGEDGKIVLDQFYDNECTMKANKPHDSDTNFYYATFPFIHDMHKIPSIVHRRAVSQLATRRAIKTLLARPHSVPVELCLSVSIIISSSNNNSPLPLRWYLWC